MKAYEVIALPIVVKCLLFDLYLFYFLPSFAPKLYHMEFKALLSNLTNPTLLFFLLGILAVSVRSDLKIPAASARFISLYLLFSIGFKGGQELAHSHLDAEIIYSLFFGIGVAFVIPCYSFFVLKKKFGVHNAGAVAAAYGSVSAVTFVAASTFLESQQTPFDGHMVAVMALMESPAIIVGVFLINKFDKSNDGNLDLGKIIHHSLTNGSVLMILGSLFIGFVADEKQAEGIKPFTTDIFKGFLALFLLEMGMVTARKIGAFAKYGISATLFGLVAPIVNGCLVAFLSGFITTSEGNRLMFAILSASASYIAVPAAMRLAAPKADAGLYIPMALGITFPVNITVGFPLYFAIIKAF